MVAAITPEKIGATYEEGSNPSASIPYTVTGTTEKPICDQLILAYTPADVTLHNGNRISRNGWSQKLISTDPGIWDVVVKYGKGSSEQDQGGRGFAIDFDTGGGTFKITHGIAHVASYVASGVAPDHKGAINFKDGKAEGVEIVIPQFNFSEKHKLPASVVTDAYIDSLAGMVGCTNSGQYRAFAAEKLLCLGVSGAPSGEEFWELSFKFSAGVHRTGLTIGGISGIDKKAWDYLWVEEQPTVSGGDLTSGIKAVHVEQVYYSADYGVFRIPTG